MIKAGASVNNQPKSCIPFMECRAKTCPDGSPGTSVFDHCRYAGYVAEALLAFLPEPLRKQLPSETPFLVSLHDIGKVSPGFEGKYFIDFLREKAPEWALEFSNGGVTTSHAIVGARSLQRLFGLPAGHAILEVVASHHGFLPESIRCENDGCWQDERFGLVKALADEFGTTPESVIGVASDASLLAGMTCVADWIASDESFFPPSERSLSSSEGRVRAVKAVAECGFARTAFRHGLSFQDIFDFAPYPAQQVFLDSVVAPGVYVLEAPMGMGKTESALYAAYRLIENGVHSGIYFALPTRLTSDRIHERVQAFLDKVSAVKSAVKLAHGQAWLKEFENGAEGSDRSANTRPPPWFNPSKRGLLFPFAVGTVDQALMAVLNVKHSFVRSFGLAGKVVILDEVHSYDAYTGTLLDELVRRLRDLGCTVIILSATLTAVRRRQILGLDVDACDGYPLLTGIKVETNEIVIRELEPPAPRTVRLRWIDAAVESPIATAVEKARAGCNVLCIANTVPTAQEWFRSLKSMLKDDDDFPIGLLHAKFTGTDRERIEGGWMDMLGKGSANRPSGSILVSTQIVEQSVDIDADWMLSEIAPADMLLQRIGRLWRHERSSRPVEFPELAIVCSRMSDLPDGMTSDSVPEFFGRGCFVYAPYVLLRTFEELRPRMALDIPSDIRPVLESVYSDEIPSGDLHQKLYEEMTKKADALRHLAVMGQSDALPVRPDDEERAGTRYSSRPTVSLLLVRSIERASNGFDFDLILMDRTHVIVSRFRKDFSVTRALYANLVQVAPNEALREDVHCSEILARHFFASDMPRICIWDPESGALKLYGSGIDAGYCYTGQLGAFRLQSNGAAKTVRDGVADVADVDFFFDNDNDW